jgi:serine/threonine protein kinase
VSLLQNTETVLIEYGNRQVEFLDNDIFNDYEIGRGYRVKVDHTVFHVWFRHKFAEIANFLEDERVIANVRREARFLIRLRHPSILQFFGYFLHPEGPALIREESACSLASLLKEGPLPLRTVVQIMHQVASALEYLHKKFIPHGAVEAANVVLMDRSATDPVVKLTNFSESSSTRGPRGVRKDITDVLSLLATLSKDLLSSEDSPLPATFPATERSTRALSSLRQAVSGDVNPSANEIAMSFWTLRMCMETSATSDRGVSHSVFRL